MIRTTFVLINHLIWTTVLGTVIILISPFDRFGRTGGKIMRLWSWIMLKASGVRYRISGLDKLDRARHYFFAANHESALFFGTAVSRGFFSQDRVEKCSFSGVGNEMHKAYFH